MVTIEKREDLYTKAEYARKIGVTRGRVTQMVNEGKLSILEVNGGVIIKIK